MPLTSFTHKDGSPSDTMNLDLSDLNIVLGVLGSFIILSGLISHKLRIVWSLGQALPALLVGIALGPSGADFLNPRRWGEADPGQSNHITLGVVRVMVGVQLVIAGYQLPSRYPLKKWREMLICVVLIMGLMWALTGLCIKATIPKLTVTTAAIIAACVTSTDPVLSQAIAKGPFADKYVPRPLREIISGEGGANDGFGVPFLMFAVYWLRHEEITGETSDQIGHAKETPGLANKIIPNDSVKGALGKHIADVLKDWVLETWGYGVLLGITYGFVTGYIACKVIKYCLRRNWIDDESYLLFPTALGLFIVGTCGAIGTDDVLACFVAGCTLNCDGEYLSETERREDAVNDCVDSLLNFGGFMYIGTIIPWAEFNDPTGTGITFGRLAGLGFMILFFRRIPAILLTYKLMPSVVTNWKEALFMGYFGPIGCGAIFYLESTRLLFPRIGEGDSEQDHLVEAIGPVVTWLVIFSIAIHGLSIPLLALVCKVTGVKQIETDAVEIRRRSVRPIMMSQAAEHDPSTVIAYNRFIRPHEVAEPEPDLPGPVVARSRSNMKGSIDQSIEMDTPWKRLLRQSPNG